jgi:hypothetical protein
LPAIGNFLNQLNQYGENMKKLLFKMITCALFLALNSFNSLASDSTLAGKYYGVALLEDSTYSGFVILLDLRSTEPNRAEGLLTISLSHANEIQCRVRTRTAGQDLLIDSTECLGDERGARVSLRFHNSVGQDLAPTEVYSDYESIPERVLEDMGTANSFYDPTFSVTATSTSIDGTHPTEQKLIVRFARVENL